MFNSPLQLALEEQRAGARWRKFREVQSAQGVHVRVDGKTYLNFSSNDYLGLAAHPDVCRAYTEGISRYGAGAGASHYVCGHYDVHTELGERLARFCGRERALLFSSGYLANLGVISALVSRGDSVYQDRLNHASLLDGGVLSRANLRRYRHRDVAHLRDMLERNGSRGRCLIATDGVFSMDGDIAPLPELAQLASEYQACLLVDDAHGFGVMGERGQGTLAHYQLGSAEVPLLMATLGKSMGVAGAFVAGDAQYVDYLEQFSRTSIYTTAMPPAQASAVLKALEIVEREPQRLAHLRHLVDVFRKQALSCGLALAQSPTQVQPLIVGDNERALEISARLWEHGIWVAAIRPPTVPEGHARLRISLSAAHSEADIERLLETLQSIMNSVPASSDP